MNSEAVALKPEQDLAEEETTSSSSPGRRPGRPRRPDTEARAYEAALRVFGDRGWSGLSLDSITSLAKLGKSSIYLRWSSKTEILTQALQSLDTDLITPEQAKELSLEEICVEAALARTHQYRAKRTRSLLRLQQEVTTYPDVFVPIWEETLGASTKRLAELLDEAADREGLTHIEGESLSHAIEAAALYCATFGTVASGPEMDESDRDCIAQIVRPHLFAERKGEGGSDCDC